MKIKHVIKSSVKKTYVQTEKDQETKETNEQISDITPTLIRLQDQFSTLETDLVNIVQRLEKKEIGIEARIQHLVARVYTLEHSNSTRAENNSSESSNRILSPKKHYEILTVIL